MKKSPLLAITVLTLVSIGAAHGQFINWLGDYAITGDSDVFTTGTYVDAFQAAPSGAFGKDGVVETVNGVAFNPNLSGNTDGVFSLPGAGAGSDGDYPYVGSADYKAVLADCAYEGSGTAQISGLTNGQEYEIQIWNSTPYDPTDYVGSTSADSIYAARGTYVLGTFFAAGTTASFNYVQPSMAEGGGSGASVIDAIEIRAVPEPSVYLTLALGFAGLAGVARLRKLAV